MQHTTEAPTEAPKQYQCRHIFTDGHRCASPCLRDEEFCYYHHTTRKPVANPKQRRSLRSTFHLPLPDPNDRSGIQLAIGQVLQRIAANDIDPRRAGLLLYGLQIASLNLPKPQSRSQSESKAKPETETETVEEITIDPTLGVLAPRAELSAPVKRKSSVAQLIENILRREKEKEETVNPGINEVAAVPAIVPILQATEDDPDIAVLLSAIPKTVILTGGGRTQSPCRRSFASRHTSHESSASFHCLDPQSIATPKSKLLQHSHTLNLPQNLPVSSIRITKVEVRGS